MRIDLSISDPGSLVKLRGLGLVEAMGYAMVELPGRTRLEFRNDTFDDDTEVVRRCVELITFFLRMQSKIPAIMEFAMEPAASYVIVGEKFEIYDFFNRRKLLDSIDKSDIENIVSYIDNFLEISFRNYSPELVDYLINRQFMNK